MKGIILAGGTGSRLQPLTRVTNKHLLPVYNKPMIFYPLETLKFCGLQKILVVSGREYAGHFFNLLGSGQEYDLDLTYKIQDGAGGIAQALGFARDFSAGEKVAVILGDNVFENPTQLKKAVEDFKLQKEGARIILKAMPDCQRFGVAVFQGDKIVAIEEKPKEPKSNYAVTGFYLYDSRVFNVVKTLEPSGRGELEITDVNNFYIKDGTMTYEIAEGDWTDAGTFSSLLRANMLVAKTQGLFN